MWCFHHPLQVGLKFPAARDNVNPARIDFLYPQPAQNAGIGFLSKLDDEWFWVSTDSTPAMYGLFELAELPRSCPPGFCAIEAGHGETNTRGAVKTPKLVSIPLLNSKRGSNGTLGTKRAVKLAFSSRVNCKLSAILSLLGRIVHLHGTSCQSSDARTFSMKFAATNGQEALLMKLAKSFGVYCPAQPKNVELQAPSIRVFDW